MTKGAEPNITDADILAVHKALSEAEVPDEDRYFYYWRPNWLAHPIKRIKMYLWLRKVKKL